MTEQVYRVTFDSVHTDITGLVVPRSLSCLARSADEARRNCVRQHLERFSGVKVQNVKVVSLAEYKLEAEMQLRTAFLLY